MAADSTISASPAAAPAQQQSPIQQALAQKPIWRLLATYSGPAIIECVCTSLYNIIDSIFVGNDVGPMALTALAICLPLMNLVIAFCNLVAMGGAAVSSLFLGKKRLDLATNSVNNVISLCLVHSVVVMVVFLVFLRPILALFGATAATMEYAVRFMRVILYATPVSFVFIGLNNLMRATGYPRKAMMSAIFSVVVNLAVCPLLILKFHTGLYGAAIATVSGQFVALIWVASHFLHKKNLVHLDFTMKWFNRDLIKRIYAIGLAPFLMNCCACVVVVFLNHELLKYGAVEGNYDVGAYGILNRVTMVFIMVVFGVTQGMQPILGFNYGAGNWERVKSTLYKGILLGGLVTAVGWVLTELCPDALSRMFTHDAYMMEVARTGFRIYFICYPVVGVQIVIQNYFQSIGHARVSIFLSLTRQLIFLLPLLYLLPRYWGVEGVWASMAGSDLLAFVVAIILLAVMNPRYARALKGTSKGAAAATPSGK